MPDSETREVHALAAEEVSRLLEVDVARGVADGDVARRRARFGANRFPDPPRRSLAALFAAEFKSIIVALLGAAAIISLATGDRIDAAVILVVLLLNAVIGFFTEWQAGRALEALRAQAKVTARIRRDDRVLAVAAEELVAGDVVLLAAGDRVPGDLRLVEVSSLTTDESVLTGESTTVAKSADAVAADAPVAERKSMAFLGTSVAAGRGVGVVTAVGERTELGKIGRLVSEVQQEVTPLQKRLDILGRRLVWIVLVVAAIVIVAGVARGERIWMMTEVGITLAVAAVPEALPAVTTFILAFGVLRMARRNAIVRRLSAVETLGSTTVICSDKTGTLTMNRMTAMRLQLPDGRSIAIPSPARDEGRGQGEGPIERAIQVMALCNDATGGSRYTGDPTEVALLDAAARLGCDVDAVRRELPRVSEFPFDASVKRMITVHRRGDEFLWLMKGAPGVVLESCIDADPSAVERANQTMAQSGLRVLALAMKESRSQDEPPFSGYSFAGLVGMHDPPRPGALEAIDVARGAGIRVIMLTGDQVETARAIARELHITDGEPEVMHAKDVADLGSAVERVDAFARVSPEDKFRIVTALQGQGEIVAVTGDGVNDAPALKKADVGIAMGERGTEVAKEAADIVLADDDFSTIVAAIEGGRTIYANIGKFVHMMLSHNLAEIITIFVPIVAGWPLPLMPLQVLWLNLATDVFPAFGLALEPASRDAMTQLPRREDTLLTRSLFITIVWQAMVLALIAVVSYRWALEVYGAGAHARTVALFALVGVQIGQTLNCRSRRRSAFHNLFRNPYLWLAVAAVLVLQLAAAYAAGLRTILGVVMPAPADWVVFVLAVVIPVVVVETVKVVARLRTAGDGAPAAARPRHRE